MFLKKGENRQNLTIFVKFGLWPNLVYIRLFQGKRRMGAIFRKNRLTRRFFLNLEKLPYTAIFPRMGNWGYTARFPQLGDQHCWKSALTPGGFPEMLKCGYAAGFWIGGNPAYFKFRAFTHARNLKIPEILRRSGEMESLGAFKGAGVRT